MFFFWEGGVGGGGAVTIKTARTQRGLIVRRYLAEFSMTPLNTGNAMWSNRYPALCPVPISDANWDVSRAAHSILRLDQRFIFYHNFPLDILQIQHFVFKCNHYYFYFFLLRKAKPSWFFTDKEWTERASSAHECQFNCPVLDSSGFGLPKAKSAQRSCLFRWLPLEQNEIVVFYIQLGVKKNPTQTTTRKSPGLIRPWFFPNSPQFYCLKGECHSFFKNSHNANPLPQDIISQ